MKNGMSTGGVWQHTAVKPGVHEKIIIADNR
jgi:hypothetical protein